MNDERRFELPQDAALAQWSHVPAAGAHVVEVRPTGDEATVWVVLQLGERTGFHDQDIVTCIQDPDGTWIAGGSTGDSSG